jgi:hypothetical protein
MNEDVLKFRKICLALLADRTITHKRICLETGISTTSLTKYLTLDPNILPKLRASKLAAMQDFNKKHVTDMNYAGIKPDHQGAELLEKEEIPDGKEKHFYTNEQRELIPTFWDHIKLAAKCKPDNVQLVITINSKV